MRIPPRVADELSRKPRSTPAVVGVDKQVSVRVPSPVLAEGSTETRTPGSAFVLPANPLMNLSDASLEGLVECRLFESTLVAEDATPRDQEPAASSPATDDVDDASVAVITSTAPGSVAIAVVQSAELAATPHVPSMLATAVPAAAPPLAPPVVAAALVTGSARRQSRRARLVIASVAIVVAITAIAAIAGTADGRPAPAVPAIAVAAHEPIAAIRTNGAAGEPAVPPAPPPAAVPRRMHAVFVTTYPIAARVVVGGRAFGTTPTYVKVPAGTPVKLEISRPGFVPVVRPGR